MAWQVWRVPTERAIALGWYSLGPIGDPHAKKEDAEMEQHLEWVDDPAPDKHDYYSLEIREVNPEAA